MKLTDLFTSEKPITDNGKLQTNNVKSDMINRQIRSMVPGQTIQGEVVSKNGNEVQIRMSDDLVLQAKLDQNMNLEIGKNVTFEVKNNGKVLTLSPLFTNVATDANVLKALDMASLPVNDTTISLTKQLMEAGLSINRNALQQVYREVNLFPQAETSDIVNLHKLQMPVNESNVTQMSSYRNLTHQLVNGLNNVLDAIPNMFANMMESGNTEGAVKLYQQLVSMIQETPAEGTLFSGANQMEGMVSGEVTEGAVISENAILKSENAILKTVITENTILGETGVQGSSILNADMTGNVVQGMGVQEMGAQGTGAQGTVLQQVTDLSGNLIQAAGEQANAAIETNVQGNLMTESSLSTMEQSGEGILSTMGRNGENAAVHSSNTSAQVLAQGAVTGETVIETIAGSQENSNLVNQTIIQEQTTEGTVLQGQNNGKVQQTLNLFSQLPTDMSSQAILAHINRIWQESGGDKHVLKPLMELLRNQWTITPEEVADSQKIEDLYHKLDRQLKNLTQTLESTGQTGSEAYKATTNLSQNLDFMNQMNQIYNYVQLPLRLQQGEAHGDLYVYTNKKHLAAKDGQISALLHLDMEHLGPVDVYVSMMQENVNTKFYLQDDELLDFMMEHMDILTERLKKRGYSCSYEMKVREQEEGTETAVQKLLQQESQIPLAEYSFDVRT